MPIRKDRPFLAPRQAKPTEVAKEPLGDDRVAKEKTLEDKTVTLKKYKGWVYIPETEVQEAEAQEEIDKGKDEESKQETTVETMIEKEQCEAPVLGKRQSVFRRQNTRQVDKDEADNTQKHNREIGKVVARDFGEAGVFRGEIVGVEYDSEDEGKVEPVYVVQYTDGDREDMDGAEVHFAHELHLQLLGIDVEAASDSCGSNDEDSYRPSPKVIHLISHVLSTTTSNMCFKIYTSFRNLSL
jgi:hypothetical protein